MSAPRINKAVVPALLSMSLAACAGTMSGMLSDVPPAPKLDMNGRWLLAANNGPPCGMAIKSARDGQSGSISPEGGCPGNFFTSRSWSFENGDLIIQNHNSELLAQLRLAGAGFEGQSTAGTPVALTKSNVPVN